MLRPAELEELLLKRRAVREGVVLLTERAACMDYAEDNDAEVQRVSFTDIGSDKSSLQDSAGAAQHPNPMLSSVLHRPAGTCNNSAAVRILRKHRLMKSASHLLFLRYECYICPCSKRYSPTLCYWHCRKGRWLTRTFFGYALAFPAALEESGRAYTGVAESAAGGACFGGSLGAALRITLAALEHADRLAASSQLATAGWHNACVRQSS